MYDLTDTFSVFAAVAHNENLPIFDDANDEALLGTIEQADTVEAGVSYDGLDVFTRDDSFAAKLTLYQTMISDGRTYSAGMGRFESEIELQGILVLY